MPKSLPSYYIPYLTVKPLRSWLKCLLLLRFTRCLTCVLKLYVGTSRVAQWLRICLQMQGIWVQALVQEDPTCCGATKSVRHNYWACILEPSSHNYWACILEPSSHNYWSLRATTTEACVPRARAPQQEKPPQWEACVLQRRVAPARHN